METNCPADGRERKIGKTRKIMETNCPADGREKKIAETRIIYGSWYIGTSGGICGTWTDA